MDRLSAQLQRLYFLPPTEADGMPPAAIGPGGESRCFGIAFTRSRDWERLAELIGELEGSLELPLPALAVDGKGGYRLWFSLAEPQPLQRVRPWLQALRQRYLADLPAEALVFYPPLEGEVPFAPPPLFPCLEAASGHWSAFIDPSLGAMFVAEPWLEMAPNLERQADLLTGCHSISPADWEQARQRLLEAEAATKTALSPSDTAAEPASQSLADHYTDPRDFLLAVMNDPTVATTLRIKAAKALLPYFPGVPR